jgi:hypothetical protein
MMVVRQLLQQRPAAPEPRSPKPAAAKIESRRSRGSAAGVGRPPPRLCPGGLRCGWSVSPLHPVDRRPSSSFSGAHPRRGIHARLGCLFETAQGLAQGQESTECDQKQPKDPAEYERGAGVIRARSYSDLILPPYTSVPSTRSEAIRWRNRPPHATGISSWSYTHKLACRLNSRTSPAE